MIENLRWSAENVKAAFEIYVELVEKGECSFEGSNHRFKLNYNNSEVFEILKEVIEPVAKVRIFENALTALYMIPDADNTHLTYKNAEIGRAHV